MHKTLEKSNHQSYLKKTYTNSRMQPKPQIIYDRVNHPPPPLKHQRGFDFENKRENTDTLLHQKKNYDVFIINIISSYEYFKIQQFNQYNLQGSFVEYVSIQNQENNSKNINNVQIFQKSSIIMRSKQASSREQTAKKKIEGMR